MEDERLWHGSVTFLLTAAALGLGVAFALAHRAGTGTHDSVASVAPVTPALTASKPSPVESESAPVAAAADVVAPSSDPKPSAGKRRKTKTTRTRQRASLAPDDGRAIFETALRPGVLDAAGRR